MEYSETYLEKSDSTEYFEILLEEPDRSDDAWLYFTFNDGSFDYLE